MLIWFRVYFKSERGTGSYVVRLSVQQLRCIRKRRSFHEWFAGAQDTAWTQKHISSTNIDGLRGGDASSGAKMMAIRAEAFGRK